MLAAQHPSGFTVSDAIMRGVSLAVGRDPVERVWPPRSTQGVLPTVSGRSIRTLRSAVIR